MLSSAAPQLNTLRLPSFNVPSKQTMSIYRLGSAALIMTACFRRVSSAPGFNDGERELTRGVLRKKEIHVLSDAIAELTADGPHTI
jgi:hypothetical protein